MEEDSLTGTVAGCHAHNWIIGFGAQGILIGLTKLVVLKVSSAQKGFKAKCSNMYAMGVNSFTFLRDCICTQPKTFTLNM